MPKQIRLPPFCGQGLNDPFLYNPYQVALLDKRRQRICPNCSAIGPVDRFGVFTCPRCARVEKSQLIARKAFHRLGIVGGRRSGKTKVGAHAAREEVVVPNAIGWIVGPTYKIMEDSTMPAFFRLIPPEWVADYNGKTYSLTLTNGHLIQFRSLDDVSRGVGVGLYWVWMDECQKVRERAWDILRPALTDHLGNAIFSWTPNGFDWTWRRIYRPAFDDKYRLSGFWCAKCKTVDNPWIQKYALHEVEEARLSMPPEMFRQEYEADFVSFSGNIYDWEILEPQILRGDAIKSFIPEWPKIDPSRQTLVGLGGGVNHPFAALLVVPTERGLVVCDSYKREHRSMAWHHDQIAAQFNARSTVTAPAVPLSLTFAVDEEKAFVMREFAERGAGCMPTEHYLMTGVQRTQTWLYSKKLFFHGDTCEQALDQLREYRWNDLLEQDGQRTDSDRDFLLNEELPKALHAALLSYPEVPQSPRPMTPREKSLSPRVRAELDELRAHEHREQHGEDEDTGISSKHPGWPMGDFYGQHD